MFIEERYLHNYLTPVGLCSLGIKIFYKHFVSPRLLINKSEFNRHQKTDSIIFLTFINNAKNNFS